jgi:hypothetical protein
MKLYVPTSGSRALGLPTVDVALALRLKAHYRSACA